MMAVLLRLVQVLLMAGVVAGFAGTQSKLTVTSRVNLLNKPPATDVGEGQDSTFFFASANDDLAVSDDPLAKPKGDDRVQLLEFADTSMIKDDNSKLFELVLWRVVVVGMCAFWASNFAAAKLVMAEPGVDSSLYALSRFSVAALALLPGALAAIKRGVLDMETARGAAICGAWVAFGYLGQTLGLLTTTASRSCIICTMHCVFVAIVAEWLRVSRSAQAGRNASFDLTRLIPAAAAVTGVAIVELQGAAGAPTIGDAISFSQPIGTV